MSPAADSPAPDPRGFADLRGDAAVGAARSAQRRQDDPPGQPLLAASSRSWILPLMAAVLAGVAGAHAQPTEPAASGELPALASPSTPTSSAPGAPPTAAAASRAAAPSARQCFDKAQADYFAGHLAEARAGFECSYAQLPSPELLWNLARVSERMGDVEQGVRYFREYLGVARLTARERKGIERRIAALLALGERQRASSVLKPGPERQAALGAEARTFFERGAKLYRAGHYKAAAAAFTAALQLSEAPELHYNLAVAAERLGETADACDHYRAYLDAAPDAPDRDAVRARILALRSQ